MRVTVAALTASLALWLAVVPRAAAAQQMPAKVPRVGFLGSGGAPRAPFLEALRELGHVDGHTITVEWRFSEGRPDRSRALAAELVRLNVDVLVAGGPESIEAARRATTTIPIVMVTGADPVAAGLVASLSNPGGNITGLTAQHREFGGKRLEFLKDAIPKLSRVAMLWDPAGELSLRQETEGAARSLGIQLQIIEVRGPTWFDNAFQAAIKERAQALHVSATAMLVFHRGRIAELATKNRLPAIGQFREFAEAGLLMSYGPNLSDLFRRAASYVDKTLKAAKPSNLPIERPSRFELVVNLKTASSLGLTIPQSVLQRADHVIE
jgi:putative ABC transport system substrate-binding protein